MKRYIAAFLLIAVLLSGCSSDEQFQKPCNLFYLRDEIDIAREDSVLAYEIIESENMDLHTILTRYFSGPTNTGLHAPFPAGTQLVELSQNEDRLLITLSDAAAQLSGIDFTLTCACVARTCFDLTQANFIELRCETQKINGKDYFILDRHSFCLQDSYYPNANNTAETEDSE